MKVVFPRSWHIWSYQQRYMPLLLGEHVWEPGPRYEYTMRVHSTQPNEDPTLNEGFALRDVAPSYGCYCGHSIRPAQMGPAILISDPREMGPEELNE
jgi:hypothetical protein